ncbi:MAG: caspase family protein [Xanthobacteraceae bacterium]
MRRVAAFACAVMLIGLGVSPGHADKRVALVIGNGAYKNAPALINPKNDAEDVGRSLRGLGFETIVAADLDRGGMNDALDRFSRTVADADVAVFYYSGHGMQFAGKNYLLPVDAKLVAADDVNRFRLVPLDDIMDILQTARGARVIVLDACRNNPVEDDLKRRLASMPGANRDAFLSRGLGRVAAGNGLIVAYATQASDVAADGSGRNSPFTAAFLHNVAVPDIDLRQMFFRVQDEVDRVTSGRQRPELSVSLVGEFKLNVATADKPATASEPRALAVAPPAGEAAQAWAVTKDTTSTAVLEAFIKRFGDTYYGDLARLRLRELGEKQAARSDPTSSPPARPPAPPASSANCANFDGAAGADRYCASSALAAEAGNSYGVRNLFAGIPGGAWVEGVPGQGLGEWVSVEFDAQRLVKSVTLQNGYQKNADIFAKNSRVKRLRLVFSQGETKSFTLRDELGPQTLPIDPPLKAFWIQLIIDEVFPGKQYTDTAISKLFVASERLR